jgi:hypothetical protein
LNPAAYRAAVARDRTQQVRRNQWMHRNPSLEDDDEEDMIGNDVESSTDLLLSASNVAMLKNARQNRTGMVGQTSQMRYDAHDAVKQRYFVGYGRGLEAAEQGSANSYRNPTRNGHQFASGGNHQVTSPSTLENILRSQYRAYMSTAARVARVHDVVNKMRVQYLDQINSDEGRESNIDKLGIPARMRRENQNIGSNPLLNRSFAYDPFEDEDNKERESKNKIDFDRSKRLTKELYFSNNSSSDSTPIPGFSDNGSANNNSNATGNKTGANMLGVNNNNSVFGNNINNSSAGAGTGNMLQFGGNNTSNKNNTNGGGGMMFAFGSNTGGGGGGGGGGAFAMGNNNNNNNNNNTMTPNRQGAGGGANTAFGNTATTNLTTPNIMGFKF